jgi:hypothetical protein
MPVCAEDCALVAAQILVGLDDGIPVAAIWAPLPAIHVGLQRPLTCAAGLRTPCA